MSIITPSVVLKYKVVGNYLNLVILPHRTVSESSIGTNYEETFYM